MIMDGLRNCLLYETNPDFIMMLVWFAVGCVVAAFGVNLIYKNENSYVKVI